jgi:hypothetical protein
MPYSVVLDFREDGGTLQVAADSGLGQSGVLRGEIVHFLGRGRHEANEYDSTERSASRVQLLDLYNTT